MHHDRPGLALILNGLVPYNVHLAQRVAEQIPELTLLSIFTVSRSKWQPELPPSINPLCIERRADLTESSFVQEWSGLRIRDWFRASQVLKSMRECNVQAVVLSGYASLFHRRLLTLAVRGGMSVFLRGDANNLTDNPPAMKAWLKKAWLGWFIRQCAGVMPMGDSGKEYFQKYGADPQRMFVVPYFPDYEAYRGAEPSEVEKARRDVNLPADRRYLLFGGRLVSIKRVDLLLDAFASIAQQRPAWDLLIAGDGVLRAELHARVPSHLVDRVRWLGFCQYELMRLLYHIAEVYVLPSEFEPWAVSIAEAQAADLVVVTSDVCGAAHERVIDGVNGRVFENGSHDGLRDALLDVTDSATHVRYHQAVRGTFDAWFEKTHPIKGLRKALHSVGLLQNL